MMHDVVAFSSASFSCTCEEETINAISTSAALPPRRVRQRRGTSRRRRRSIAGADFVSSSSSSVLGSLHLLLLLVLTTGLVSAQDPQQVGYWEGPYELPIIATAAANLADGNLLLWGSYDKFDTNRRGEGKTWTAVYDYRRPNVKPEGVLVETTGHDTYLPDGRILISGGSNNERVTIYDNGIWKKGTDTVLTRGYHSATVTVDGAVFTMDGEIWDPATGRWKLMTGTKCEGSIVTNDVAGQYRNDNHMWLFTAPNGKIFHAGPSKTTHYLSLDGKGSVTAKAVRGNDDTMVGNAVMYDVGKILTLGGSPDYDDSPGVDAAHIITLDATGATDGVTIEQVDSLVHGRTMSNSVVLPNGQVVVVGGMVVGKTRTLEGSIFEAELFDPVTKQFTEMAKMKEARQYHSSAILLPDGRVWAGGGGHCTECLSGPATNKFNCEIYTPPYLVDPVTDRLTTNRPVITVAPSTARPGESIVVTTLAAVENFALVRLSAVTHSTNNDLRRVPLTPSSTVSTTYTLPLPTAAICLPGTYFLFVLDAAGVPSVATTISIRP